MWPSSWHGFFFLCTCTLNGYFFYPKGVKWSWCVDVDCDLVFGCEERCDVDVRCEYTRLQRDSHRIWLLNWEKMLYGSNGGGGGVIIVDMIMVVIHLYNVSHRQRKRECKKICVHCHYVDDMNEWTMKMEKNGGTVKNTLRLPMREPVYCGEENGRRTWTENQNERRRRNACKK